MVSAPENLEDSLPKDFLTNLTVEPVGRWFLSHWERLNNRRTVSSRGHETESESDSEESDTEIEFEDDIEYLRSLDPKECKEQDHYRVLGLTHIRFKATDEQIKKAHRFKVLRHHPDKRRAAGEEIRDDDDYFTCITKASEILGNPEKRRAFDSVDPLFDDDIPEIKKKSKSEDFYNLFSPAFKRNSRWSVRQPVPKLGEDTDPIQKVEKFYKFWYDFQSWREYSYLDEEDKEKGSDREERRWIEKNNKIQRAERKKEEMKRIRKLVDNAYNADPRIAKFKEEEKQEKMAKKKAKQDAIRARKEEEERLRRESEEKERVAREMKQKEEKAKAEEAKRAKEQQKRAIKKERKTFRTICKEKDFFAENDKEKVSHMAEIDKICEILTVEELEAASSTLKTSGRQGFLDVVKNLNDRLEKEKQEMMERNAKASSADKLSTKSSTWSSDDLALLIKAVNLFPAGTNQRWEVVTNFLNQHSSNSGVERNPKEVLSKAKELQGDFHTSSLKEEANKKAYQNLEKQKKREVKVESEASKRMESAAEAQGLNVTPWTPEEQQLLEQALKTYPASLGTERWDKISSCIPNRSRKDCMKRYKELAELVRAKKAAQAAAAAKK